MTAIFKREFSAYFKNPIGWVFLAIFWFFCGLNLFILVSAGICVVNWKQKSGGQDGLRSSRRPNR